jgi:multidrug efflux system membrane fusion protein
VAHSRADVQALDGEIDLTQRRIQGQEYATAAARAAVQRAEAQARSAADTYNRLVPLAQQEFVTAERLDQARASKLSMEASLDEARRKMMQAEKDVGDLNSLRAKRDAAAAALGKAELDLSHTRVEAPFDALVVNLHTAVGAFVTPGPVPVFALVDTRHWYVLANYRESELGRIAPGMAAEVYLMANPRRRFRGTVQGIGWAVNPEDGRITPGIPTIQRELNWVHIAQRFPVRIDIDDPQPADLFRVGASAVTIVLGYRENPEPPAAR